MSRVTSLEERTDQPPRGPADTASRPRPAWVGTLLGCIALVLLAVTATLPQLMRAGPFSVFDEATHLDYAHRVAHGEIPATGDPLSRPVLDAWACYDTEFFESPVTCGVSEPAREYNNRGEQYNSFHPPLYYAVSGVLGRAVEAVSGLDLVQSVRATGVLWLAAGMVVLALAARSIGLRWRYAVAAAAVAGTWWPVLTATTHASNDAPVLLSAGLAIWVAGRIARGKLGPLLPFLVSLLVAATKVMTGLLFLVVGGVALLMAIFPALNPRKFARWRLALVALAAALPVAIVQLGWSRLQSGRGNPDFVSSITGVNTARVEGNPIGEWLDTLLLGFSSFGHSMVHPSVASAPIIVVVCQAIAIVALAGPFLALALARVGTPLAYVAIAVLAGYAAWPLLVQLQAYQSAGAPQYFPAPGGRYGMALVPIAIVSGLGAALRLRWGAVAITGAVLAVSGTLVAVWVPTILV